MDLSFDMKIGCFLSLIVAFLLSACVEQTDLPVVKIPDVLVVDGMFTDQEGIHSIKLFYSSPLNGNVDDPVPVTGATALILDNLGNTITTDEDDDGNGEYSTPPSARGSIGVTYKVRILLSSGAIYESIPATMVPAGSLDAIEHKFRENAINPNELDKPQDAIELYLDGTSAEESNLLRWRWKATYYVETYPERIVKGSGDIVVPKPLPCSGYVEANGELVYKFPCTCCRCWPVLHGDVANVSQPQNAGDRTFVQEYIGRVPFKYEYFFPKMVVEVDQLSVSEEVHKFWQLVRIQTESAGNIFQPNIVKVRGNIRRLDKPDEKVFGVFSVSAVVSARYTIHDYDLPKPVFPPDSVKGDCRSFYKASNEQPFFW